MRRVTKIDFLDSFKLLCLFDNGETRVLDLQKSLNGHKRYTSKILNEEEFKKAKIGKQGQIYWENIAKIKDLRGKTVPCEYDICPDYAYSESVLVESTQTPIDR